MKQTLSLLALLALTAVGAAWAYQTAARERDYRTQIRRGDQFRRDGDPVAAIEAFSGALALKPEAMLPYLRRGEAYAARGDVDNAARDFRAAANLDPSALRPLDELGDVFYQRGRYDAAAESYERRLRLDDRSPGVMYKLALARYRDGDVDAALRALDDTIRVTDSMAPAHYVRGLCLRDLRRLDEASAAFERALVLAPNLLPAREELADTYATLGRADDAIEQLQLLASLDRAHVDRPIAVALAHARAGHTDLAVLTLDAVRQHAPDDPVVSAALGQVWLDLSPTRPDALNKALQALEHATSTASASSRALALYGRALLRANQPEAAEGVLQEALQRYPVDPTAYVDYADAAQRQDHVEAARNALEIHAALASEDAPTADEAARIGALSLTMNDPPTAIRWLQRAAAATPTDASRLARIAEQQVRAGDRDGALETIRRGLERDPDHAALVDLDARARRLPPP